MSVEIAEQVKMFLIYLISGSIIGILFDVFRIIRRSFKISDFHTLIEDIIFGLLAGLFLIFVTFIYNNGNLRLYMFFSIAIGLTIYMLTISKYFIKINVKIILFIKFIINKILQIILVPFKYIIKFIKKILNKPFMFLTINFKKIKNILIRHKKQKNKKILLKKKDFNI